MEEEGGNMDKYLLANTNRVYTTDNAHSCISTFENKDSIGRFDCLAHIFNVMVTEGLTVTEITELLNKLCAITDFYHESPNSNILLK